ncbi:MAG TPA: methyltransferase [Puia sp.]|nr:methyltransferase [Puia sp.]
MSKSYFQFKQFIIHQDRCAMKVCTDACILGAWIAGGRERAEARVRADGQRDRGDGHPWSRALDIGSGTGLLMLMLAQKNGGSIQGIELDSVAFGQLQENIAQSKWKDRLGVVAGDAKDFVSPTKFDLIISNPPFFEGDLPAASHAGNLAKHSKELTLAELIRVIDVNLGEMGSFGILLPWHRVHYFEELAAGSGFYWREKLLVRQGPKHDFFRAVLHFSRGRKDEVSPGVARVDGVPEAGGATVTELTIKDDAGNYTEEFVGLMKDYYLYL